MKLSTRQITVTGVLSAITVVLGLTPIGFIEIPGVSVTTMHIPTILAGIYEGPVVGGIVGALFGLFSFWRALTAVNPLDSIIFTNPIVAFLPRIFVGLLSHYVFSAVRKRKGELILTTTVGLVSGYTGYSLLLSLSDPLRIISSSVLGLLSAFAVRFITKRYGPGPALAAIAGSLVNTVFVLGFAVLFGYIPFALGVTFAVTNGIPEAAAAMILVSFIYRGLKGVTNGK